MLTALAAGALVPAIAVDAPGDHSRYVYVDGDVTAHSDVARAANQDHIIAWDRLPPDDTNRDIWVRVGGHDSYDAIYFNANSTLPGDQLIPAVAMDADGDSVVVWYSPGQGGIFGRRLSRTAALDSEFLVAPLTSATPAPAVAISAAGDFVVAWQDSTPDGEAVFARMFAADGTPRSPAFAVNIPGTVGENPDVAAGAAGQFAIVWEGRDADGARDVRARLFGADGTAAGDPFDAHALPDGDQWQPSVAMDASGDFVVAWTAEAGGSGKSIHAQRFSSSGVAAGAAIDVPTAPDGDEQNPDVAMDADGDFVVAWAETQDARSRVFTSDGNPVGLERAMATDGIESVAVAMDADGDFISVHPQAGAIVGFHGAGPESVDVAIEVAGPVTPVPNGTTFTYAVTIANLHPGASPTGIAAIDGGIGAAEAGTLHASMEGAAVLEIAGAPEDWYCWITSGGGFACQWFGLVAGASVDLTLTLEAGDVDAASSTFVTTNSQYDAEPANDTVIVDTPILCDRGSVEFSQAATTLDEGNHIYLELRRTGGTCGEVRATYGVSGTAQARDYYRSSESSVSWRSGASADIGIYLLARWDETDDISDQESVVFSVESVSDGAAIGAIGSTTVTINDRDGPPPVHPVGGISALEGEIAHPLIWLQWLSEKTITVSYRLAGVPGHGDPSGMPATPGSDFLVPEELTVVIPPLSREAELNVQTVEDALDEALEGIGLRIEGATNASVATDLLGPTNIIDDDPTVTVQMMTPDGSVAEGTTLEVRAVLSAPSGRWMYVPLLVESGADDLSPLASHFVFLEGQTEATVTVLVNQDGANEGDEAAALRLGPAIYPEGVGLLGTDVDLQLTILNVDPPPPSPPPPPPPPGSTSPPTPPTTAGAFDPCLLSFAALLALRRRRT